MKRFLYLLILILPGYGLPVAAQQPSGTTVKPAAQQADSPQKIKKWRSLGDRKGNYIKLEYASDSVVVARDYDSLFEASLPDGKGKVWRTVRYEYKEVFTKNSQQHRLIYKNVRYELLEDNIVPVALHARKYIDSDLTIRQYTTYDPLTKLNAGVADVVYKNRNYSARYRRNLFLQIRREMKPHRVMFTLGLQYTPSFANRFVLLNTPRFQDNAALNRRDEYEGSGYGHDLGLRVGITLGNAHSLFAAITQVRQGFNTSGHDVNWINGSPVVNGTDRQYSFLYRGLGLGYSFSRYERTINFETELSLHHLWLYRFSDGSNNWKNQSDFRDRELSTGAWAGKVGLGFNIRPTFNTSIRVMPSMLYSFSPVSMGTLKTRLFNAGITIGADFRFPDQISFKRRIVLTRKNDEAVGK